MPEIGLDHLDVQFDDRCMARNIALVSSDFTASSRALMNVAPPAAEPVIPATFFETLPPPGPNDEAFLPPWTLGRDNE